MQNEQPTFVQLFEDIIPDDATCVSVKVNMEDYDADTKSNFTPPHGADILRYLKDSGVEIISSTAGVHIDGRNKVPHIHYHFITKRFSAPTNPSQHRKRWMSKSDGDLGDASFKYQKLDARYPKYQFLSYPMKEGILPPKGLWTKSLMLFNDGPMENTLIEFLKSVGTTIYQTQIALRVRQEKSQERKQLALSELYEICRSQSFSNMSQMMKWLDINYINTLELEDYPDPKNYKVNCQKIAVKLGILKYSEL